MEIKEPKFEIELKKFRVILRYGRDLKSIFGDLNSGYVKSLFEFALAKSIHQFESKIYPFTPIIIDDKKGSMKVDYDWLIYTIYEWIIENNNVDKALIYDYLIAYYGKESKDLYRYRISLIIGLFGLEFDLMQNSINVANHAFGRGSKSYVFNESYYSFFSTLSVDNEVYYSKSMVFSLYKFNHIIDTDLIDKNAELFNSDRAVWANAKKCKNSNIKRFEYLNKI